MKLKLNAIVVCVLAIAAAATVFSALATARETLPPAEGKEFWGYIHKTNPYTKWAMWPGMDGMYEGKSPHGKYVRIFVNKPALEAAKAGKAMPYGAIIVKENFKDKKTLASITPMYRVKGYNPAGGDWYWTKIAANGKILGEGKLKGCIRCHKAVKSTDWVFTK